MNSETMFKPLQQLEQRFAETVIILIWLGIPLSFIIGLPIKFAVCLYLITSAMVIAHSIQAYIFHDRVNKARPWLGVVRILVFGAIELRYLKQQQLPTNA